MAGEIVQIVPEICRRRGLAEERTERRRQVGFGQEENVLENGGQIIEILWRLFESDGVTASVGVRNIVYE